MAVPHGDYLVVTHPNGTVYFVVYPPFNQPTKSYSLMPSKDFRTVETLKLPWDVRAIPRVYGRDTVREAVFSGSGRYEVRMGENLESDSRNVSFECQLTFSEAK